jgi:divalent metal cation (Fe/Co/Zn/Cd) transporter
LRRPSRAADPKPIRPRPTDPSSEATRARLLRQAILLSVISVLWNGVAGSAAVVLSFLSGSLSLAGFGFDAVVDSAASVALIWRFTAETREPHRAARVEKAAERVVGITLIVLGVYVVAGAMRALATASHPDSSAAATVLLVASLIVLPPLAILKRRVADSLRSGALRGDSILTGVAALLAAISLSAALLQGLGLWWADAVGALVVAVVLLREGWGAVAASRLPPEE